MKVPKARKLSSGKWFIQLRLGGESIPITARTEKECIRQAQYTKAEYLAGKREVKEEAPAYPTLYEAIDEYIKARSNVLSPATIRGYRCIQKHRFVGIMQNRLDEILTSKGNLQSIVNAEAALCSTKTLRNSFSFLRSVILDKTGQQLPPVKLSVPVPRHTPFLQPEEIPRFIAAVMGTEYALASLLALSSMRLSEIWALCWEDIPLHPNFIHCTGAVVKDEHNRLTRKKEAKNETSARNVPILIPQLREVLEKERKPSGPVVPYGQTALRDNIHKICRRLEITDVSPHGLRHSFASLCYHLNVPKKIAMETGGWKDDGTMERIYTHVAQSDIKRYQTELAAFYEQTGQNSGKSIDLPASRV